MSENELLCTMTIERKPDGERLYSVDGNHRDIKDVLDDVKWAMAEFKKTKIKRNVPRKGMETG